MKLILQKICLERDIEIIEDEISDVLVGEKVLKKLEVIRVGMNQIFILIVQDLEKY